MKSEFLFPKEQVIMNLNRANHQRRRGSGADSRRGLRRLRPTVMALEGRALLSTFTVSNTADGGGKSRVFDIRGGSVAISGPTASGGHARAGGGLDNDGGTLSPDRAALHGHRARAGGLLHDGAAAPTDAALRGDTALGGSGLFSARKATLHTRRGHSRRTSPGPILSDNFNGTGGVPKNWTQILGHAGDIQEKPHALTITDSTGGSAGIASVASGFNPQKVVTTDQVQINGVNSNGNAIFGFIGLSSTGSLTGYLAAGIDAHGNVFVVEQDSSIPQTIVPIGVDQIYKGGPIQLTFIVNAKGVQVMAPGFNSGEVSFKNLNNFSLAAAFGNGAIPALVGASQPNEKGGSAIFGSIKVSTALGR
jgi:hypothetical protein